MMQEYANFTSYIANPLPLKFLIVDVLSEPSNFFESRIRRVGSKSQNFRDSVRMFEIRFECSSFDSTDHSAFDFLKISLPKMSRASQPQKSNREPAVPAVDFFI